MDLLSVKIDLIHWLTELQDQSVLEKVQELKEKQESSIVLSKEQQKELQDRIEIYDKGEMEFSSWDSVKNRIRRGARESL
ncbi:addiction module protein [Algoriphagus sp. NF]|jgi:putative addiction module component (TIGR02574 family)|uniref:addiction module protein n=1 Tax=Algoriphagus sp. NF TaxID=2992756 RepID=UPI0010660039|nr:addiction module protein [Algoriphagus sp. NF]MDE0560746.1 addiction module protein [Algoriphagus sp. NF]